MPLDYIYGKPGISTASDGSIVPVRLAKDGSVIVSGGHGIYHEAGARSKVFYVANQTGVATQAGLSATTPVLTLYNPIGSGVNLSLIYAGYIQTVAAIAAAAVLLAANTNTAAAAVTGTATTAHRNGFLGGAAPAATPLLAATLPAAPVGIAILGALLTGAITTVPGQGAAGRFFDGSIVMPPNTALSIQTTTASGALGMLHEFVWEEVPV